MKHLLQAIKSLKHAGKQGFEGLICDLLGQLTGRRFVLARGGYQGGRDTAAGHGTSNMIHAEAKHYGTKSKLNPRELLGELAQAISASPNLDLWVLVTTTEVDDQLLEQMKNEGLRKAIEVDVISSAGGASSELLSLCASFPETLLCRVSDESSLSGIQVDVDSIREFPGFNKRIEDIERRFEASWIGYDSWRCQSHIWLQKRLSSGTESRATFRQPIEVTQKKYVQRDSVSNGLSKWLDSWTIKGVKQGAVLLGEHGDGKTWAMARWLDDGIVAGLEFPPIVFCPSHDVTADDPLDVIASAMVRFFPSHLTIENWRDRFERWVSRSASGAPVIILAIDGIDESKDVVKLRGLLESLEQEKYSDKIAMLATCRERHWEEFYSPLSKMNVRPLKVEPFSAIELDAALENHGLSQADFSLRLIQFAKKPRYFSLIVKHRMRLESACELTASALIFEDWKERFDSKRHLASDSPKQFELALRYLAKEAIENEVPRQSVTSFFDSTRVNMLNELSTCGALVEVDSGWRIDPALLTAGLGLVLAESVNECAIKKLNLAACLDVIWSAMEPQPEMDEKGDIIAAAIAHAFRNSKYSSLARLALLRGILGTKSLFGRWDEEIGACVPADPEVFLRLAEELVKPGEDFFHGSRLIAGALLRHDVANVTDAVHRACRLWLGFVCPDDIRLNESPQKRLEVRARIRGKVKMPQEGAFSIGRFSLTVVPDLSLLQLGGFALDLLSFLGIEKNLDAVISCCLAETIHGVDERYGQVAWVLRSSMTGVTDEILGAADELTELNSQVGRDAALTILRRAGLNWRIDELRSCGVFFEEEIPSWLAIARANPCEGPYAWNRKDCRQCIGHSGLRGISYVRDLSRCVADPSLVPPEDMKERISPVLDDMAIERIWESGGSTSLDTDFEGAEPVFCRFSPKEYAQFVRSLARLLVDRRNIGARSLSAELSRHSLILGSLERKVVNHAWKEITSLGMPEIEPERTTAQNLLTLLLFNLPGQMQLRMLIRVGAGQVPLFGHVKFLFHEIEAEDLAVYGECSEDVFATILWFSAITNSSLPDHIAERAISLIDANGAAVSNLSDSLFVGHRNQLICRLKEVEWRWDLSTGDENGRAFSWVLARDSSFEYSKLRCRIRPDYLGVGVAFTGKSVDASDFAEDLDQCLSALNLSETNEWDAPWAQSFVSPWFERRFTIDGLREVAKERPELVDSWIAPDRTGETRRRALYFRARSFFHVLCHVLIEFEPQRGRELLDRLLGYRGDLRSVFSDSGANLLDVCLFKLPGIEVEWWKRLGECTTDLQLLNLVIVAESQEASKGWVLRATRTLQRSPALFHHAIAATILGVSCILEAGEILQQELNKEREDWVAYVAKISLELWERGQWAEHWLQEFCDAESDQAAWASLRLFVHCADPRSGRRVEILQKSKELSRQKRDALAVCRLEIRSAIRRQTDVLKKTFLTQKFQNEIAWPWSAESPNLFRGNSLPLDKSC